MKLNWNFVRGGRGREMGGGCRVQDKKPFVGVVWIFSGTAQCRG